MREKTSQRLFVLLQTDVFPPRIRLQTAPPVCRRPDVLNLLAVIDVCRRPFLSLLPTIPRGGGGSRGGRGLLSTLAMPCVLQDKHRFICMLISRAAPPQIDPGNKALAVIHQPQELRRRWEEVVGGGGRRCWDVNRCYINTSDTLESLLRAAAPSGHSSLSLPIMHL